MYGVIDFYRAAKEAGNQSDSWLRGVCGTGIHVLTGKQASGEDRYYHLVLLAENNQGYANLMKIVSKGFVEGYYYQPRVDMEVLEQYHEGIIALAACLAGEVQRYLTRGMYEEAKETALKYEEMFWKRKFLSGTCRITESRNRQMVNQQLLRMHQETWH